MTRKPPDLPNIEDATLRACLAPLMDAMNAPQDLDGQSPLGERPARFPDRALSMREALSVREAQSIREALSMREALAAPEPLAVPEVLSEQEIFGRPAMPATLAEWRQTTDEDFDAYRTIERFLAMTDADLETAAAAYPRQFASTAARIARIKGRLEAHYQAVAAVQVLLRRALNRSGQDRG